MRYYFLSFLTLSFSSRSLLSFSFLLFYDFSFLGELENELKRNLSPTRKYLNNEVTEKKLNNLKKEMNLNQGKKKSQIKQINAKLGLKRQIKEQDIVCCYTNIECPAPHTETSRPLDLEIGVEINENKNEKDDNKDIDSSDLNEQSNTEYTSHECTTPDPVHPVRTHTQTHTQKHTSAGEGIGMESKGVAGPKSSKRPGSGRIGTLNIDRKPPSIIITPVPQASTVSNSLCNSSVTKHTLKSKSMSKRIISPSYSSSFPSSTFPSSSYPSYPTSSSSSFLLNDNDEMPFDSSFSAKNSPDLSIFKSPLLRQRKTHQNQYNTRNCAWVSTQLTGKYNTRFQYTSDITNGKKLNQMLNS